MKSLTESEQKLVNWLKSEFKNRKELAKYKKSLCDKLRINYPYLLDLALPSQSFEYTLNDCIIEALKYKTKNEWRKKHQSTYLKSLKNGWHKKCCQHMAKNITIKDCMNEALKYKTRTEWAKKHPSTYSKAVKNGWIEKCSQHMSIQLKFRTLEECKKIASKYKTRNEWKTHDPNSYAAAVRNGWLSECCQHMEKPKGTATKIICSNGKMYKSQREAARRLNLSDTTINAVLKGRQKSAGGYTFKYVDEE